MTPTPAPQAPPGALLVEARNIAFVPTALDARGRKVTVALRNRDLFWHTFAIDAVGLDLSPIPPTSRFVSGDLVRVGRRDGLGMGCGRR
jgi:hypothetical protein